MPRYYFNLTDGMNNHKDKRLHGGEGLHCGLVVDINSRFLSVKPN
jgi:hypothetical protein